MFTPFKTGCPYHLPGETLNRGFVGQDLAALGIPTEAFKAKPMVPIIARQPWKLAQRDA